MSINLMVPKMGWCPPMHSRPPLAFTRASPLPFRQLSGWLWCWIIKRRPPKAKAMPIALFFDGVCVSAPNEGTSSHKRKPATGRLHRTHSKLLCLDLRPWGMLPWRKMAKPLEGRAMAAHVGCWVFCVFVFCVVFEWPFSYRRGRKLISAKAKLLTLVQS